MSSKWFPLTDRLWLERASFGRDRISAEVDTIQVSHFLQGFNVTDLMVAEEDLHQFS
jgi:hypothetical protein